MPALLHMYFPSVAAHGLPNEVPAIYYTQRMKEDKKGDVHCSC